MWRRWLARRRGRAAVAGRARVQSLGFPRYWSDSQIRYWLQRHGFTPLKAPHRTEQGYTWVRLIEPSKEFRYRTGSWTSSEGGDEILVRYVTGGRAGLPGKERKMPRKRRRLPSKGRHQGGRNVKHNAEVFLDFLSASQKRKLDRIFPVDAEWAVEPTSEDFPELPLWLTTDSSFWEAVMAERVKRGKGGRRNVELPSLTGKMLPVSNPAFNVREIVKHMILLEDHLAVPAKRCPDCMAKHLLAIEALADEAASLDREQELGDLPSELAILSRQVQGDLLGGEDPRTVAQGIRSERKKLLPLVFPYRRRVR